MIKSYKIEVKTETINIRSLEELELYVKKYKAFLKNNPDIDRSLVIGQADFEFSTDGDTPKYTPRTPEQILEKRTETIDSFNSLVDELEQSSFRKDDLEQLKNVKAELERLKYHEDTTVGWFVVDRHPSEVSHQWLKESCTRIGYSDI